MKSCVRLTLISLLYFDLSGPARSQSGSSGTRGTHYVSPRTIAATLGFHF